MAATKKAASDLTIHICQRLQGELGRLGWSQATLGKMLAEESGERWPQSRVWKLLNAKLPLTIDVLATVAQVLQLSLLDLLAHPSVSISTGTGKSAAQLRVLQLLQRERLLDADADVALIVIRPSKPQKKPGERAPRLAKHAPPR